MYINIFSHMYVSNKQMPTYVNVHFKCTYSENVKVYERGSGNDFFFKF